VLHHAPPRAYDAGRSVRARIAGRITLVVAAFCFVQAANLGAHALGWHVSDALRPVRNTGTLALGCGAAGVVAVLARRHFERTVGSVATVALCMGLAVLGAFSIQRPMVETVMPQVIWLPTMLAAVVCEIRWIPIVAATMFGILTLRLGDAPPLRSGFAWVNVATMTWLVWVVRWLHDKSLTEAERAHASVLHARDHDDLTHLPNRHRFETTLDAAPIDAPRAVLRVDIEQFGVVSESVGRAAGDAILRDVAATVHANARHPDDAARAGGDDFLLLLRDTPVLDAERAATSLADALEAPREVEGRTVHLTVRIGIATVAAGERADAETVLQRADQAVLMAKRAGRRRIATLATASAEVSSERAFQLSQDLHGALGRGELHVVYQPIFDLVSGRATGAEALVRWTHPRLGPISPGEFIPIAEANGTIHAIGDWVFRTAASQAQAWRTAGADGFRMSINRSPVQFHADGDGPSPCVQTLAALGVDPDAVVLEITEGVLLDADACMHGRLTALRHAGVHLSLDDFGTGYSSIAQLHAIDLDVVKIDRRFVSGLAAGSKDHVLCESIVRMSHALGLRVVAEGIETEAQREHLRAMGCDAAQGYLLGRPMGADALERVLLPRAIA
jgi:diguanylate cyclase (GGDEF)-like protein